MILKLKEKNESLTIAKEKIEKKLNGIQVQIDYLNIKNKNLYDSFYLFHIGNKNSMTCLSLKELSLAIMVWDL